eukprot:1672028-Amphidinium_carterae.1
MQSFPGVAAFCGAYCVGPRAGRFEDVFDRPYFGPHSVCGLVSPGSLSLAARKEAAPFDAGNYSVRQT